MPDETVSFALIAGQVLPMQGASESLDSRLDFETADTYFPGRRSVSTCAGNAAVSRSAK